MTNIKSQPETFQELAKALAEEEGKARQVDIAQINELLAILGRYYYDYPASIGRILYYSGLDQKKKKEVKL